LATLAYDLVQVAIRVVSSDKSGDGMGQDVSVLAVYGIE
jgi:hypothetical protein